MIDMNKKVNANVRLNGILAPAEHEKTRGETVESVDCPQVLQTVLLVACHLFSLFSLCLAC